MIPKKQRTSDSDWIVAWEHIQANPDRERAEALVGESAEALRRFITAGGYSKVAYGWSGGKDSLALELVVREAGVNLSVMGVSGLEYPEMDRWTAEHLPEGCTSVRRINLNMAWLLQNPSMLFPKTSALASKWYAMNHQRSQREYARDNGIDLLVLGRRRADGNNVGSPEASGLCVSRPQGQPPRVLPISEWSHEDVLNAMVVYGSPIPPYFSWPRGFRVGTGPWAERRVDSNAQGWAELAQIDMSILEQASTMNLEGAREALQREDQR